MVRINALGGAQRRRAVPAACGAVLVLAGVIAVGAPFADATGGGSSLTTLRQGQLSSQVSASGTLGYANPQTVYGQLSGTITWLPAVGQVIRPGQVLYRVENQPVVLFSGDVPAYRDLSEGISDGPDVAELKRNLVALGFDPDHQITVNQSFGAATATAVERWQASLGEPETGKIALGQVVFLPGARRITKVDATLGTGAAGASSPAIPTAADGAPPRPEFASLTTTTTTPTTTTPATTTPTTTTTAPTTTSTTTTPTTSTTTTPTKPTTTPTKPARPTKHKKPTAPTSCTSTPTRSHTPGGQAGQTPQTAGGQRGGGAGGQHSASGATSGRSPAGGSGNSGAGPQPVLETTSTTRQVRVDLDASQQSGVKVGDPVQITLPDNQSIPGRVTSIGAAAGSGSSGATVPVDASLRDPKATGGLDQAPVQVEISSGGASSGLIAPVASLLALAGNRYAVEAVEPTGAHRVVPVTVGRIDSASGMAQVSGAGLSAGQQVVVPTT
jgi:Fe2+ transport system protein FeoA